MKQRRLTPIICAHCHEPGMAFTPDIARGKGKYCSRQCSHDARYIPVSIRLESRTVKNGPLGCWRWTGATNSRGYGIFSVVRDDRKGSMQAHRAWFEYVNGPIGDGLTLDHLCRNTNCVNPAHMEPVSSRVNTLRGEGVTARNAKATHCINGHPFSGENLFLRTGDKGHRRCRICDRAKTQKYRARNAEQSETVT